MIFLSQNGGSKQNTKAAGSRERERDCLGLFTHCTGGGGIGVAASCAAGRLGEVNTINEEKENGKGKRQSGGKEGEEKKGKCGETKGEER